MLTRFYEHAVYMPLYYSADLQAYRRDKFEGWVGIDQFAPDNARVEGFHSRFVARYGEAGAVELASAIAWENYRARFNWAFGLGKEGYSEGAYCVPVVSAN